jgi:hypothetical protein
LLPRKTNQPSPNGNRWPDGDDGRDEAGNGVDTIEGRRDLVQFDQPPIAIQPVGPRHSSDNLGLVWIGAAKRCCAHVQRQQNIFLNGLAEPLGRDSFDDCGKARERYAVIPAFIRK